MANQNEVVMDMELGINILGKILPNCVPAVEPRPQANKNVNFVEQLESAKNTETKNLNAKERKRTKSVPIKKNNHKVLAPSKDDITLERDEDNWEPKPPFRVPNYRGRGGRNFRGRGHGQVPPHRTQNLPPSLPSSLDSVKSVKKVRDDRFDSASEKDEASSTDTEQVEKAKNHEVQTKAPYNLRNAKKSAEPLPRTPIKPHVCDDKSDDGVFKKPGCVNNLTICQLLRPEVDSCSSPVAGGNLASKVKHIEDDMPRSPPSSTSTMSAAECQSKLKDFSSSSSASTIKEASECANKSILRPSGSSVDILEQYESLSSGGYSKTSSMKPMVVDVQTFNTGDPGFMPISLALGKDYLFACSQSTNQAHVFKDGRPQGVLKINGTKYFKSVHNVHTMTEKSVPYNVMVLDNEGCHCYVENGLYIETLLDKQGHKYRGLTHTTLKNKWCMVTLDIRADEGVDIVFVDITPSSEHKGLIVQNIKIPDTIGLNDDRTKCRFVMAYKFKDIERIFVTAVKMNKIFVVDPQKFSFRSYHFDEPTGIAYEPKNGNIFVSSRSKKNVQVFNWKMEPLGTFLKSTDKFECSPIGLFVHEDKLYVANNENGNMLQVKFKL